MARPAALPRVHAITAPLDAVELAACLHFNAAVRRVQILRLFRVASRLGDGVLWYSLMAWLALFHGAQGRVVALQCAVAGIAGLALYRALKGVLVRERPFITHHAVVCAGRPLDRFSFPSGHTLHAVSFTFIVVSAMPAAALVLVPMALLIGMSRVVLGLHYPSDVLAGALLGVGVAEATLRWLPV